MRRETGHDSVPKLPIALALVCSHCMQNMAGLDADTVEAAVVKCAVAGLRRRAVGEGAGRGPRGTQSHTTPCHSEIGRGSSPAVLGATAAVRACGHRHT